MISITIRHEHHIKRLKPIRMKIFLSACMIVSFLISCNSNQEKKKEPKERGARPSSEQLISEMDSNKDGKLSESEAEGPLAHDFMQIDSDKDGFLTVEELNKTEKNQGKKPPQLNDCLLYTSDAADTPYV